MLLILFLLLYFFSAALLAPFALHHRTDPYEGAVANTDEAAKSNKGYLVRFAVVQKGKDSIPILQKMFPPFLPFQLQFQMDAINCNIA